jgi:hypothetical protein
MLIWACRAISLPRSQVMDRRSIAGKDADGGSHLLRDGGGGVTGGQVQQAVPGGPPGQGADRRGVPAPIIRSPSQCLGHRPPAASAGRSEIITMPGIARPGDGGRRPAPGTGTAPARCTGRRPARGAGRALHIEHLADGLV